MVVLDFKDRRAAAGHYDRGYPEYGRQLEGYVEALRTSGLLDGHRVHAGLVFTGSGERAVEVTRGWVPHPAPNSCFTNSSRVMPNCSATSARTLASVPIRSTPWAGTVT